MAASIRFNGSPGPLQIVAGAVALSNFNNTGVLGWHWELLDRPTGSAAAISSPFAAAPAFTADTPGSYRVRLRTYVDAARTVLDAVDIQIAYIRFPSPFVWRKPAAGETREVDAQRGWATAHDEFENDAQTYMQGGLQSAFEQVGTIELAGATLSIEEGGSPVFTFTGSNGRARMASGTLAAPGLSFIADAASGFFMSSAGKWDIVANGVAMIDFQGGAITFGERAYTHSGLEGTPGLAFSIDPDTGWYRVAANTIGFSTGGTLKLAISTVGVDSNLPFRAFSGSAANPHYEFGSDLTTGMFLVAAGVLGFSVSGTERARLTATGGLLAGNWLPSVDLTYNLGDPSFRWNNLWVSSASFVSGLFDDGLVGTPSIAFSADTNTGFYRVGSGSIGVSGDGLQVVRFQAVGGASPQAIFAVGVGANAPSITFHGDQDTGFYNPAVENLAVVAGGIEVARFRAPASANPQLLLQDGAAGAPALAWSADTDTGLLNAATLGVTAGIAFIVGGSFVAAAAEVAGNQQFIVTDGSLASPALTFDTFDSGLYAPAADVIAGAAEGVEVFRWQAPLAVKPQLSLANGQSDAPSLAFTGALTTGLWRDVSLDDDLAVSNLGTYMINVSASSLAVSPGVDNAVDLGQTGRRWSTLWTSSVFSGDAISYSWVSDTNTFISRPGSGIIALTGDALEIVRFQAPAGASPQILAADGSAAAPAYGFAADTDVGFYRSGTSIGFSSSGSGRYLLTNVGITTLITSINWTIGHNATQARLTLNGRQDTSGAASANPSISFGQHSSLPFIGASQSQMLLFAEAIVNQTGTSSFDLFRGDTTNTALGSGDQNLFHLRVGGSSVFKIKNSATASAQGQLQGPDGVIGTPTFSFISDPNTGVYSGGADVLAMATGGTQRFSISTAALTSTLPYFAPDGTAGAPTYAFTSDPNTGIFSGGADVLAMSTAGTQRFSISTSAVTSTLQHLGPDGSAGAPTYSFSSDPNTGIYWSTVAGIFYASCDGLFVAQFAAPGGATPQFGTADGTAAAPSHTFAGDGNTGMYSAGADKLGFTTGGTLRLTIDVATSITSTLPFYGPAGAVGGPTYSFSGDTNTGIYSSAADEIGFSAGGTGRIKMTTTSFEPITDNVVSLGVAGKRYTTLYSVALNTGDIDMRDPDADPNDADAAHWKLVEGKDCIFAYNKRTKKKYRFAMIEDTDISDLDRRRMGEVVLSDQVR